MHLLVLAWRSAVRLDGRAPAIPTVLSVGRSPSAIDTPVRRVWRSTVTPARTGASSASRRLPCIGLAYVCPSVCLFQVHLSVVNAARLDAGPLIIIRCCNQWVSSKVQVLHHINHSLILPTGAHPMTSTLLTDCPIDPTNRCSSLWSSMAVNIHWRPDGVPSLGAEPTRCSPQ